MRNFSRFNGNAETAFMKITYFYTIGNIKSLRTVIYWQILKKVILNFV